MNYLTPLIISLVLAGCATSKPAPPPPSKPVVITQFVRADCGTPPARAPIEYRGVTWRVLEYDGQNWFALSAEEYADLAENTSATLQGARELRAELSFYEECLAEQPDPGGNEDH